MVGTVRCTDGDTIFIPRDAWCEPVVDAHGVFTDFGRSMRPQRNGQAWPQPPEPAMFDASSDQQSQGSRFVVFARTSRKHLTTAVNWAVVRIEPPKPPSPRRWHRAMRELALQ